MKEREFYVAFLEKLEKLKSKLVAVREDNV